MEPRVQFEFSTFTRRQILLMAGGLLVLVAAVVGVILLVRGGGDETPEAAAIAATTPPPTASLAPSPSPAEPSPSPSPAEEATTAEPAGTPTLEPYQYTVEEGDTLYYIVRLFGYADLAIVDEVIALNGLAGETDIQAGQTILIPQQTPTPAAPAQPATAAPGEATPAAAEVTAEPGEPTATQDPNATPSYAGCGLDDASRCISPDGGFWLHEVVEGETCAGLARAYDTTVPDVLNDNNLTDACIIAPGEILRIRIKVTLTPTLTPTGGPGSTATPTPTLSPPSLIAPANGATVARGETVVLQWVAAQQLPAGASYLVRVRNTATDAEFRAVTGSTIYRLPESLAPSSGAVTYEWTVVVVDGSGEESPVVSGQGSGWSFTWGS